MYLPWTCEALRLLDNDAVSQQLSDSAKPASSAVSSAEVASTSLRAQINALDTQLADREIYLKLANDLEGFLASSRPAPPRPECQRVLRLLVKDVLVGPEKMTIRHRTRSGLRQQPADNPSENPVRRVTVHRVIHCAGGVVSPVLANLFMHYAFVRWLVRQFPAAEFERFADNAMVHCATELQASQVPDAHWPGDPAHADVSWGLGGHGFGNAGSA
jgi:hypothetical protein